VIVFVIVKICFCVYFVVFDVVTKKESQMQKWGFVIFGMCLIALVGLHWRGKKVLVKTGIKIQTPMEILKAHQKKMRRNKKKKEDISPVGLYRLDRKAMIVQAEKALALLPKKKRVRGQVAVDQLKLLDLTMVLNEDGSAEFVVTRYREGHRTPLNFKKKGKWSKKDGLLIVSSYDASRKKYDKSRCFFDEDRLICIDARKNLKLIFMRQ